MHTTFGVVYTEGNGNAAALAWVVDCNGIALGREIRGMNGTLHDAPEQPQCTAERPGSDNDEEEGHIVQLLRRAHQRASAILTGAFGVGGFTPPQFAILHKLLESGAMSQNSLGRAVAMDAATTQGVVHRLVSRGLVQRSADPADRRRVSLSLTTAGRQAVEDALERAAAAEHAVLAPLNARERQALLRLLRRIA